MIIDPGLEAIVSHLRDDGFVAYATETVWGLGACADRPRAVDRLFRWKGRSGDAPMSLLVPSADFARRAGCRVDSIAGRLMERYWPGPLTVVVPCARAFAPGVARADGAIGLRCSAHPLAGALAESVLAAGLGPLTSTSLNRSGEPPAETEEAARALVPTNPADRREPGLDLDQPLLVRSPGADAGGARPSSVVDCTGPTPRILREGAIAAGELEALWSGASGCEQEIA